MILFDSDGLKFNQCIQTKRVNKHVCNAHFLHNGQGVGPMYIQTKILPCHCAYMTTKPKE